MYGLLREKTYSKGLKKSHLSCESIKVNGVYQDKYGNYILDTIITDLGSSIRNFCNINEHILHKLAEKSH